MFSDFKQEQGQQTRSHMGETTSETNFKMFKLFGHEFIIRELKDPNVPPATESAASSKFKLLGYEFTGSDRTVIQRPKKNIESDGILSFKKTTGLDLKIVKSNDKQDDQISKQDDFPKEKPLKRLKLFGCEFIVPDFIEPRPNHYVDTVTEADMDEHHRILSSQEKTHSMEKSVSFDEEGDDQILGRDQTAGSKRKHVKTGGDEERVYEKEKPFKKRKRNYSKRSCWGTRITQHTEPAELPERFKNRISEIGGTETTLLIQKSLSKTDISEGHGRLLMALKQMKNPDFLLNTELQELQTKGSLTLPMVEPSLQIENIVLTKWNMCKPVYVLRTNWNKIVKVHELKVEDVVQIWSFRIEGQINLALVKVI